MCKPRLLIVINVLLAFLLRVNGLNFGLPYNFHDAEHQYTEAGLAFLQGPKEALAALQKLNNPPLFKVVLGALDVGYAYALLPNLAQQRSILATELWGTFFHYVGRLASMAAGLLTVALLYPLGQRLYGRKAGLLAAFLLAVSFLHVRESHFAVNDAPLTFLATLALYFMAGILRWGRWRDYLAAGLVIGLAGATKYTGFYLVSGLAMAHLAGEWRRDLRAAGLLKSVLRSLCSPRWLVGLAMTLLGFLLGAPVMLTAWGDALKEITKLAEYGRLGYHGLLLAPDGGWIFYLDTLAWGVGFLMAAGILVALALSLMYRRAEDLLLLIYPLLLFALMGAQKMVFARFILPVLPPLLLLLAAWLWRTSQFKPWPRWVMPAAVVLLILQPLVMSGWLGVILNRRDTREMAAAWAKENIPAGAVIYAEDHALPRNAVTGGVDLPYVQADKLDFDYPDALAYYRARGVQFILSSDFHHDRLYADPVQEAGRQVWLAQLEDLQGIQEFQPYGWPGATFAFDQRYGPWSETLRRLYPGPIIRVYRLAPPPNWHGLNSFVEANRLLDKADIFGYAMSPDKTNSVLSVYWRRRKGWAETDRLFAALVNSEDREITRVPAALPPDFQADWDSDRDLFKSNATLVLPPDAPPGVYQVVVKLYDTAQAKDLAAVRLEQAQVTKPRD